MAHAAVKGEAMNSKCGSSVAAENAPDEQGVSRARRRQQLGPDQIRPLGPKAAMLHTRRQRLSLAKTPRTARAGEFILATEDGALAFSMRASHAGLYVERTQRRPLGARLVQFMVFDGSEAFLRWCTVDPVRFDHPLLFGRLRRQGDELLRPKS